VKVPLASEVADPPPGPPAESPWTDSSQVSTHMKKPETPSKGRIVGGVPDDPARQAARRVVRTWQGLFLVALAVGLGNAVAELAPDAAARVETATAGHRATVLASPDVAWIALGGAGGVTLLVALMALLAGRPRRRASLAPVLALALPALYVGLVPGGQKRLAVHERDAQAEKARAIALERDGLVARIDSATAAAKERDAEVAALEKKREDEAQTFARKLDEQTGTAKKAAEQDAALAKKSSTRIAELESALKAQDAAAQKLRAENEGLKRRAAELAQTPR
jgi:hypothetical protein